MIQAIFTICMFGIIGIGFHCARHLTSDNPLWVRLVVLCPCMTAFITLIAIVQGYYVAYSVDILRALSLMIIYALVGSHFGMRCWLDIKRK